MFQTPLSQLVDNQRHSGFNDVPLAAATACRRQSLIIDKLPRPVSSPRPPRNVEFSLTICVSEIMRCDWVLGEDGTSDSRIGGRIGMSGECEIARTSFASLNVPTCEAQIC
ncbi:hypothetical protein CaCOL14_006124 [Colletotrichum acutatum]